jgi:hypothetical protein
MPAKRIMNDNRSKAVSTHCIQHVIKKIRKISNCENISTEASKNNEVKNDD